VEFLKIRKMLFVLVLLFVAPFTSYASHHGWAPVEAFSNTDGTLQFVEMYTAGNNEGALTAAKLEASNLSTNAYNEFTFTNISSATAGKSLLIATSGFEAAFGITPDFIVPDGFLTVTAGDVWYNTALTWTNGLPTDGFTSFKTGGVTSPGTPRNFSGETVTLSEPAPSTTSATQFLMTTSTSANVTTLHLVNTAAESQSFTGTLYNGDGEQLGDADIALHTNPVTTKGRVRLTAIELEMLFGVDPWKGPALLEVTGADTFELMGKLVSPSGLVSNTNCVRDTRVLNIEGEDSPNNTFVRFINTSDSTISDITGTLYDLSGSVIGTANVNLRETLLPRQAVWINRKNFEDLVGETWQGEALLEVGDVAGLKLLNLNFVNGETFFNFSCFESSGTSSGVYLMTTSTSANISSLHVVNTATTAQSFSGTLYHPDSTQLGEANQALHEGVIAPKGRVILTAENLESIFEISPWKGPALLDVSGAQEFELMIKLQSPSGLISNTNCIRRDEVHNIEGFDSPDMTFVRFINTGNDTMGNITGTLYDTNGQMLGAADTLLLESLAPKEATWLNRNQLSSKFDDVTWNGEALLSVNGTDDLRLLNLNFANSETFFNFSCYQASQ
jgi:hypothetical protein